MLYKCGRCTRDFWGRIYFYFSLVFYIFSGVFNKTVIPLALVRYEVNIAN